MKRPQVLLLSLSLFLTGGVCEMVPTSEPIRWTDVTGTYEANFDSGLEDRIELNADGSYVRHLTTHDSIRFVDHGKWVITWTNLDSTHAFITFKDFRRRFPVLPGRSAYSDEPGAEIDSLARSHGTRVRKYTSGKSNVVRIGNAYGDAWVKKE